MLRFNTIKFKAWKNQLLLSFSQFNQRNLLVGRLSITNVQGFWSYLCLDTEVTVVLSI